jgi:hypothetical protein
MQKSKEAQPRGVGKGGPTGRLCTAVDPPLPTLSALAILRCHRVGKGGTGIVPEPQRLGRLCPPTASPWLKNF